MAESGQQPASGIGDEFDQWLETPGLDPYPMYERARNDEPVFFSSRIQAWYVTRYDDVLRVLSDVSSFAPADPLRAPFDYSPELPRACVGRSPTGVESNNCNHLYPLERISAPWFSRTVSKFFVPARLAELEIRVRRIAIELIDGVATRGLMDLVQEFIIPLTMRAILDVLGAPECETASLKLLGDDWQALTLGQLSRAEDEETRIRVAKLQQSWMNLINERRITPQPDLFTAFAVSCKDGERLTTGQIVNACSVMALSGHETTANLIGLCLYHLLRLPARWRAVCEDPANISRVIEEVLRADTPVQTLMRATTKEVRIGSVTVPRGARVALLFASANRDEVYFHRASEFNLFRDDVGGHIAFGHGVHFCLGAPLARMEARVALELLIERLHNLRLASTDFALMMNPIYRAIRALPVVWDGPHYIHS